MARKKFIIIHTYHDGEAKKKFWLGTRENKTSGYLSGQKNGIMKRRNVPQLGLGRMIFSFVSGRQKIHRTLSMLYQSRALMNSFSLQLMKLIFILISGISPVKFPIKPYITWIRVNNAQRLIFTIG